MAPVLPLPVAVEVSRTGVVLRLLVLRLASTVRLLRLVLLFRLAFWLLPLLMVVAAALPLVAATTALLPRLVVVGVLPFAGPPLALLLTRLLVLLEPLLRSGLVLLVLVELAVRLRPGSVSLRLESARLLRSLRGATVLEVLALLRLDVAAAVAVPVAAPAGVVALLAARVLALPLLLELLVAVAVAWLCGRDCWGCGCGCAVATLLAVEVVLLALAVPAAGALERAGAG